MLGLIFIPALIIPFLLINGFKLLMAKNEAERQKWRKDLPDSLWIIAVVALLFTGAVLTNVGQIFFGLGILLASVILAWIHLWWPKFVKLLKTTKD